MRFCVTDYAISADPFQRASGTQREPVQGDLRAEEICDEDLLRQVSIARVVNPNRL